MASSRVMVSTSSKDSDLNLPPSMSSSTVMLPSVSPFLTNDNINNYASGSITSNTTTDLHRQSKVGGIASTTTTPTSSIASVDSFLRNVYSGESSPSVVAGNTLLDSEIAMIDSSGALYTESDPHCHLPDPSFFNQKNKYGGNTSDGAGGSRKTVDDVWNEIVGGTTERKECKVETADEMMTLEDFLAKAGAVPGEEGELGEEDAKDLVAPLVNNRVDSGNVYAPHPLNQTSLYSQPAQPPGTVEGGLLGFGMRSGSLDLVGAGVGGRGKRRGGPILEPMEKAVQQRQRRMIKNRESAARSRERKQAYQVELESLASNLEEENEQLMKEKVEWTKGHYKQLMEKVVPVVEKRRPPRPLRRVSSM